MRKKACAIALCAMLLLLLGEGLAFCQGFRISGTVTDPSGEPVIGASILENGTNNYAITDFDGSFSFSPSSQDAVLTVHCIGYVAASIPVNGRAVLSISLEEESETLNDVVVIGYGTARKKDLTGAIATVKAEGMESELPRSVEDILRSGVAGLYVDLSTSTSGASDMQIRGKNTLTAGSAPLLVVDGVIYGGELTDINPLDIQSIDVLKDASSVAVYGAKAANGVLAITTKKGHRNGKPDITFSASLGIMEKTRYAHALDGAGFLELRRLYEEGTKTKEELAATPGMYQDPRTLTGVNLLDWYNYDRDNPVTVLPDETELVSVWLKRLDLYDNEVDNYLAGKEENWDNQIFRRGISQDYTVSIQNRTDKASYYWSIGYVDRTGTIVNDDWKILRSRLNLDFEVTKFLKVGMNMQFTNKIGGDKDVPDVGSRVLNTPYALNVLPDVSSPYAHYTNGDANCTNPFYDIYYTDKWARTNRLMGTLYAKVTLPFGFVFTSNFSPDLRNDVQFAQYSSKHDKWSGIGGKAKRTHSLDRNWQIDNILSWNKSFGRHHFEMTLLQNAEKKQYWESYMYNQGFSPSDILGYHSMQSGIYPSMSTEDTYLTGDALMARLHYAWDNRYLITLSVRRDGYSAFGINNPRATFPSAALAWVFSEEPFMKKASWLNYGKLRLSYGVNGNNSIGQYEALATLASELKLFGDQSTGSAYQVSTVFVDHMGNSSLKWERTSALNGGIDLTMFDSRLRITADAYRSLTRDLLVSRSLPSITGFTDVMDNLGLLRNYGFELTVDGDPIKRKDFKWTSTFNFSFNRRRLLSLYGDMVAVLDEEGNVIGQKEADDVRNGWYIGHDPDQIFDYEMAGVWQIGEEEEARKYGLRPGDFKYVDQQPDGALNTDDKVFGKYKTPRFYVSWRNEFSYKNFSLSMRMYSMLGHWKEFNLAANRTLIIEKRSGYDLPKWTESNPINDFARVQSTNLGTHYANASFLRLDNISLAYSIPDSALKKLFIRKCQLSLSVRNPFIITAFPVNDPEGAGNAFRTVNLGLNLTL